MGNMKSNNGSNIKLTFEDHITMKDTFQAKVEEVKTGRSVIHHDSEEPTATTPMRKLVTGLTEGLINNNASQIGDYTEKLKSFLAPNIDNFNHVKNGAIVCYRGVWKGVPIKSATIGPAPSPSENRYNKTGEKCLYLIDKRIFIPDELELNPTDPYWQEQKYEFPAFKFNIADISSENQDLDNTLGIAFQISESGQVFIGGDFSQTHQIFKTDKNKRYRFSQILSELFKDRGWDGIFVPGVLGHSGMTYHNVVVFESIVDQWKDWTVGNYYKGKK